MPTLFRIGPLAIKMYADDHNPPHFHVVTPDREALVSINGFRVLRGEISRADLDLALGWARRNEKKLRDEWSRLNER